MFELRTLGAFTALPALIASDPGRAEFPGKRWRSDEPHPGGRAAGGWPRPIPTRCAGFTRPDTRLARAATRTLKTSPLAGLELGISATSVTLEKSAADRRIKKLMMICRGC